MLLLYTGAKARYREAPEVTLCLTVVSQGLPYYQAEANGQSNIVSNCRPNLYAIQFAHSQFPVSSRSACASEESLDRCLPVSELSYRLPVSAMLLPSRCGDFFVCQFLRRSRLPLSDSLFIWQWFSWSLTCGQSSSRLDTRPGEILGGVTS